MQIEQALKQKKFKNEFHKLRVNLLFSAGWLNGKVKKFLAPYDITQKQFNILRILRGQYPDDTGMTIMDIRDRMVDKMSDASRIVNRIYKKDLIGRKPCIHDKRHTRVWITGKGMELLAAIDEKMPYMDNIFNLTEEQARTLNCMLEEMREG
ncbi:MAG: DNA-binding MarR family transcriptional regulator [Paraglaciecola sp.]|jgi:DNA-binding MarR family transcriptional regulator